MSESSPDQRWTPLEEAATNLVLWLFGAYGNPDWPQGEFNEHGSVLRDRFHAALAEKYDA